MSRSMRAKAAPSTLASANFSDNDGEDDSDFEVTESSESDECVAEIGVHKKDEHFDVESAFEGLKADEAELTRMRPPCRRLEPQMQKLFGSCQNRKGHRNSSNLLEEPIVGKRRVRRPKLKLVMHETKGTEKVNVKSREIRPSSETTRALSAQVVDVRRKILQNDEARVEALCMSAGSPEKVSIQNSFTTGARTFFAKLANCQGVSKSSTNRIGGIKKQARAAAAPYLADFLAWERPREDAPQHHGTPQGRRQRLLCAISAVRASRGPELEKKPQTSEVISEDDRQRDAQMRMRTASSHCGSTEPPSLPRCVQGQMGLFPTDDITTCAGTYEIRKDATFPGKPCIPAGKTRRGDATLSRSKPTKSCSSAANTIRSRSQDAKTQGIEIGSKLVCLGDDMDMPVPIFASPQSNRIIGHIKIGERVMASGEPCEEDDFTMLPISPAGAVQLDYFTMYGTEEEPEEGDMQTAAQGDIGADVTENVGPAWATWEKHFEGDHLYQQLRPWLQLRDDEDLISSDTAISLSSHAWKRAKIDQGIANELKLHPEYGALERLEFINRAVANETADFLHNKKASDSAITRGRSKREEAGICLMPQISFGA